MTTVVDIGEVEHQDTDQHEDAAKEGVEQEFPCRVNTPGHAMFDGLASPDADEQEHWGQFDFPEEKEEKQVDGHKDTHHAGFQDKQQSQVFLDTRLLPAANDREHR